MAKCVFCEVDIDIDIPFRNATTYNKSVWVACPNCGHLHLLSPIMSYDWEGATVYSQKNKTTDDWGKKVVPHIPITREVLVMSADNDSGCGTDKILHNIGEGIKLGMELKQKNPDMNFTITIKKYTLTDEMIEDISWEDYFFDYDLADVACETLDTFTL